MDWPLELTAYIPRTPDVSQWLETCEGLIRDNPSMTAELLDAACNEDRVPESDRNAVPRLFGARPAWGNSFRRDPKAVLAHAEGPSLLEVDYARDLDDAPTFPEALAALEAWKARRAT